MSNTHGVPDSASEIQAILGDLQAPCILSSTFPTVPVSSLTLAAFATHGYVLSGTQLVYVAQAAAPVTLSGADGQFWVALHRDTSTAVASWTRQPGTHYLWRSNPTKPANPAGGLILSQVTVAGGIISAVSQTTIPNTPLSLQDAEAVAITGGTVRATQVAAGTALPTAGYDLATGTGFVYIGGRLGLGVAPPAAKVEIFYTRTLENGITITPHSDTAGTFAIGFTNAALTYIGSITTTGSATAYNTASDPRLKEAVVDLDNPLQVIAQLRPVAFRWKRQQTPGRGFLSTEVAAVVPEAVTGDPDAVDAAGEIIPQQIDFSKLVPYLVGAVKALVALNTARGAQIAALTARVAALEAQP